MHRKLSLIKTIIILAAVMCTGCSLNYEEADISDTFSEQLPNSVLFNFSQTVVENRNISYSIAADRAALYDQQGITYFDNIIFREYDDKGQTGTEGAAEKAIYNTNNDNIIFDGKLIINAIKQDFIVRSDYIEWDNEKKIMKSLDNTKVSIEQGDGTRIEGTGFIADASGKSFTFLEKTEGKFIDEDKD
ncbi:MAG: LPS export ABC transporter periplasmic protein LptC [Spirochaetia bacterium]|nr:LPS export ABC transporter periplasmic protein LptC [Spirochaetia bacterium]